MLNYTTDRESHWPYIIKQLLISTVILSLPVIYDLLFPTDYIKETYYWISVVLLLAQFIDLTSRHRIHKIIIDEGGKTITQYYRSSFSGEGEKIHTLVKVQLYVKNKKAAPGEAATTKSLVLYKEGRGVLNVNTKNDGFAPKTLQEIRLVLERLGVPVTG